MSFKTRSSKNSNRIDTNILVLWIANIILKGIAELSDFIFDLDTRTAYVQLTLFGEVEPIEVSLDGFSIVSDEESHQLIIQQAKSNRPWLNNLLSRIVGKAWKIPAIPQYKAQIEFIAELFKAESPEQEEG